MKDKNVYPYYENAVAEYLSKYKEILFVPGRAVQARELTGVQTLKQQQDIENWNTVYKHGSIVDGCDVTIITSGSITYAKLASGKFYYDGRILTVDEQSITIDGTGTENLGFYVEETFITHSTDDDLLDRAYGVTNYGLAGADRLKIDVLFVIVKDAVTPRVTLESYEKYDDEDGVNKIWNLEGGIVQNYIRKPDYSLISKTLAQRTFHESGHYLVEGMNLQTELANDSDEITITITPGICYVYGYSNIFVVNKSVDNDKSLELKQYLNEPHTFSTGTYLYELIYPYVDTSSTITITAIVRKTIYITRGGGDYDAFEDIYGTEYTSIESIVSIPGYVEDTDYELLNDQVHWLGGGSRPGGGVDYTNTFRYYKDSVRDTDFTVILDPYQTLDIYYVSWLGVDDPDDGTNFLVDYYIYLARTDLISIDKDGNIIVKQGSSTYYDETKIPAFGNDTLPIGWIKFLPGKDWDSCIIYEYNFRRSTMFDLHYLRERVDTLEENLSYLALEREVKEGEDTTLMTGLFVDDFTTLYRCDVEHDDYNIATNLLQGQILLQSEELLYALNRSNDVLTDIETWTDSDSIKVAYTMDYTSTNVFFEQKLKSDTMNLNPYGFILNLPVAKLDPKSDFWVKETVKEKTIVQNKVTEVETNIHQLQWVSLPNNTDQLTEKKLTSVGEKVSASKVNITERIITLARNISVTVYGKNFEPISNVTCVCGGIYAPLTAVSPYLNETDGGTSTGKIIVAANGTFKGTFTIPQNVKSGNIKVEFIDDNNPNNVATIVFRSKGIQKIIENQTLITRNFSKTVDIYNILPPNKSVSTQETLPDTIIEIPKTKPAINPDIIDLTKDPLAQSFIFKDDKVIISIDLWFGTKADDAVKPQVADDYYNDAAFSPIYPAILNIGYMTNGFPDSTQIIHSQEIYPEDITTSLYGTTATNIVLEKPVFIPALKDFYISIGSKSTEYTVFVAVMEDEDLESGNVIMKQAYQDGSLFASSNGITWTAVQEKDLAIRLYEGVYPSTSTITLPEVTFPYTTWTGYGRFLFINDYIEPPRTKVFYYYSTDSGTTWNLFNPADEIALSFLGTALKFKIELSTDVETLTPIIELDNNLIFFKYDISEQGQYRTLETEDIPEYNSVKLIVDESAPSGTAIHKEFSIDSGTTWFRLVRDAIDSRDIGKNFYKNIYLFEFELLQKLTLSSSTGYSVGDNIKYVGSVDYTGKITAIDGVDVYIILNDDGETRFTDSHQLTNGTTTKDIDSVEDYLSEPTWPTDWTGRILMESTSVFKSPVVMNYRAIMKII